MLGNRCGVLEDACMTHRSISLNTLRALPAADRAQALAELAANAAAPRNGQSPVLDARIRRFEQQYEMTSDGEFLGDGFVHAEELLFSDLGDGQFLMDIPTRRS